MPAAIRTIAVAWTIIPRADVSPSLNARHTTPAEVAIQFLGIAHGVPVVQPGHGAGAGHVGQYTVAPSGIR